MYSHNNAPNCLLFVLIYVNDFLVAVHLNKLFHDLFVIWDIKYYERWQQFFTTIEMDDNFTDRSQNMICCLITFN